MNSVATQRTLGQNKHMASPYGFDIVESCLTCPLKADRLFCNLPEAAIKDLEAIKSSAAYPRSALLYLEGQNARGIFILCSGRAKLLTSSGDGKTIILKVAEAGEVLGLSATISGRPYEATVEILEPAQANFIPRDEFLRFLRRHGDVALRVAQQLSSNCHTAYQEIRCLGLTNSASEKLARLLVDWSENPAHHPIKNGKGEVRVTLTLTQEEIAQMIGASRETVTRLFTDFKKKGVIQVKGASLIVRDKTALARLAG